MRFHEHLENLAQDIRYAARGLIRRPAFTAVAVLTIGIGVGATTTIFSAVNALLLRPLPFSWPEELMKVSLTAPADGARPANNDVLWIYPRAATFRADQQEFNGTALYVPRQFTITSGQVELVRGEIVSASYLRTLGLQPLRGRDFDVGIDAQPGAATEVMLSEALWRRRYNADPAIVGRNIDIDGISYAVVGIAPAGFLGLTGEGEFFVPITARSAASVASTRTFMVARRKPGVSEARLHTAVALLGKQVSEIYPDNFAVGRPWSAVARPLDAVRVTPVVRQSLMVLAAAVAFVLLIACVNVANLLLGRSNERQREIAVRLALGASRDRVVRLLLTESTLLAILGGATSLVVAWLGIHALSAMNPAALRLQRGVGFGAVTFSSITLDWAVLAVAVALATIVGVAFGLAPALHATRASLSESMKEGASTAVNARRPRMSPGRLLVVAEVALALVLLASSGLMIRSLGKLLAIDPGFDPTNVLSVRLTIPPGGLARDALPGFYTEVITRLGALPGVTSVGLTSCAPLSGGCEGAPIDVENRRDPTAQVPIAAVLLATPEFFAAARVPLKRGRLLTTADHAASPKVTVISETAARTLWPNEDPIGKNAGFGTRRFEVIGVVGDVREWPDSVPRAALYLSYHQWPSNGMFIFIRTASNPDVLGEHVRRILHDIAPQNPVYDMQLMTARAAVATAPQRFIASLLGLFAAIALSLAAVGIYGVISLSVAARTREIGIRIALGADQGRVQRLVVGEGIAMVSVGAVIGLVGALLSTRVLQALLFDLRPSDPLTYATALVVLGGAAVLASWIPARRASRVDPVSAFRTD
ncbi:MAG: ABC transporter permease [Gemmatimonadaceae bacterium]|nr:ABC transporter permease [Gemmatimonadaceae bacterium]